MKKRRAGNRDPIISEIRDIRESMARRAGYDSKKLVENIRVEAGAIGREARVLRGVRKPAKGRRRAA